MLQHDERLLQATILLVIDHPETLHRLVHLLKQQGYKVLLVSEGRTAVSSAQKFLPDVILLDGKLPGMTGYEVCRQLKVNPQTQDISVIFLGTPAAQLDESDEDTIFFCGSVDYLTTPFHPQDLLARISIHLTLNNLRKQLDVKNAQLHHEIFERKHAEDTLKHMKEQLEQRVHTRTAALQQELEERKRIEATLRQNEANMQAVVNHMPVMLCAFDEGGNVIFWNERSENVTGYTAEEVIGNPKIFQVLYPDKAARNRMISTINKEEGDVENLELTLIHKDGTPRVITWSNVSEQIPIREWTTWAIGIDITERKRFEEEQKKLALLIDRSKDWIGLVSLKGEILYMNQAGLQLFGMKNLNEARTTTLFDYLCEEGLEKDDIFMTHTLILSIIKNNESWRGRLKFKSPKTNRLIPVEVSGFLIKHSKTGRPAAIGMIGRDITERKEAEQREKEQEQQLCHTRKIQAIGILADGIAHDFNNILSTVLGYTDLLIYNQTQGSREREYLECVRQAGKRATDLVKQILTFSRAHEHHRIPICVSPVIKEVLKLMQATLPPAISIHHHIASDCHPILADATQIHQVIVNLCTNACYAMKKTGGRIEVSVEEIDCGNEQAHHLSLVPGTYLRMTVHDTGCGMTPEVKDRIFDPFFTTKSIDKGTGLGLSIVHGIIKDYGGVISVDSAPGQGTTFLIYFPIVDDDILDGMIDHAPVTKGTERILIVDDEPTLVQCYEIALKELGYQVTTCNDSYKALKTFRNHPNRYDIVFAEQAMPNMTGLQLCRELRRIRPDLPIILAAGYRDTLSRDKLKRHGIRHLLSKPVDIRHLNQLIQEIFVNSGKEKYETHSHY